MRFYKTCHTLTTIQPRKKMKLTKVVSPPKRFCGPVEARCANRIFCLKNQPTRPLGVSLRGVGASEADFLGKKCDYSLLPPQDVGKKLSGLKSYPNVLSSNSKFSFRVLYTKSLCRDFNGFSSTKNTNIFSRTLFLIVKCITTMSTCLEMYILYILVP